MTMSHFHRKYITEQILKEGGRFQAKLAPS